MYKSIYNMAVNLGLEPTPGFRKKFIKAHIVLDERGNYQRIEVSSDDRKILCPDKPFQMKGFTGNAAAQFIADYAMIVLYTPGLSDNKEDKYTVKHQNFVRQLQIGRDEEISILKPVADFLTRYDSDEAIRRSVLTELENASIKLPLDIISFRVGTDNVETDSSWINWYKHKAGLEDSKSEMPGEFYSAVTGAKISPITGKYPKLVGGHAGSGVPIFSSSMRGPGDSQLAATKSYGSRIGCPMSESEANTIVSGLDYVLNEEDQYSPDFNICWWYDSEIKDDLIKKTVSRWERKVSKDLESVKQEKLLENRRKSEEYKELLTAAENGQIPKTFDSDYKYHIVNISFPSKGRIFFENEYSDTYKSLYQNLNQWYIDSSMMASYFDFEKNEYVYYDRTIKNIFEILYALKLNSKDNGKDGKYSMFHKEKSRILKAVYTGSQIPESIFRLATEQYTRYMSFNPDAAISREKHISEENAACILALEKIFLLRNGGYNMGMKLTPDNGSVGYQCGRWLAVIDKLQEESLKQSDKKVNRTLSSRFYKQAKRSPAKAFSILNDYIKVYEDRLTDYKSVYEKQFGEISEKIGIYFPDKLSVKEQGAFDLGFAQQKQAFYKKQVDTRIENAE
jgi:CRISPR-associated protein Cas8c/Csd1 subtype I-C